MTVAAWTSTNQVVADRLTTSLADSYISQLALLDPNNAADLQAAADLLAVVTPARDRSVRFATEQSAMRFAVQQLTGSAALVVAITALQTELNSDDAKRHGVELKLLNFPPPNNNDRDVLFELNQAGDLTARPTTDWVGPTDVARREATAADFAAPNTMVTISGTTSRTYENLILRCAFSITTTGTVIFKNCIFYAYDRAWGGETAIVVCNTTGTGRNTFFEDCLFDPSTPSMYINAITGHDFTVKRCIIRRTTDGIGCQNQRNPTLVNGGVRVDLRIRIQASIITDLSYWTPDAIARPNSHNDDIQVFEGYGVEIIGNILWDNVSLTSGTPNDAGAYGRGATGSVGNGSYPAANGQCVALTPTKGHPITGITVKFNYMDYGEAGISITNNTDFTGNTGHIIVGNRFGTRQGNINFGRDIFIAIDRTLTVPGFVTGTNGFFNDNTNDNVYDATGLAIPVQIRDY